MRVKKPIGKVKAGQIATLVFIVVCVLIFMAEKAMAYELSESGRKWMQDSVEVYTQPGCAIKTNGLLYRASRKYNVLDVTDGGINNFVGYDGMVTLYCAESDPTELVWLPEGVNMKTYDVHDETGKLVLGSARSYWNNEGRMLDCDIRLHPIWVSDRNVEGVAAHEFGHCVGLDHSSDPLATMFSAVPDRDTLHADDHLAICELYGECRMWDDQLNLIIPPTETEQGCFYGYLPSGKVWPDDVVATPCDYSENLGIEIVGAQIAS